MCGRYMVTASRKQLAERFAAQDALGGDAANGVVAPSQTAAVVTVERKLEAHRWGLKPEWEARGVLLINARAETLTDKPTFRDLLAKQRCLIPANGFFEWERLPNGRKRPLFFRLPNRGLLAFAGLWMASGDGAGRAFTIITTEANEVVQPVHNRMPVILTPETEATWLRPDADADALLAVLQPLAAEQLRSEEGATLLAPPAPAKQPLLPF
jgi:putative SOS response-associated peptidase YedK